jgi:hypothetical protein
VVECVCVCMGVCRREGGCVGGRKGVCVHVCMCE